MEEFCCVLNLILQFQVSSQVHVKLVILSPTAWWPEKTRLELWLELGVRGMPKQYLEWD